MAAIAGIDELSGNPNTATGFADTSFQYETDSKFPTYLLDLYRFAFVGERGVAGDDKQARDLREVGDDVLGNAITEIFLFRIATHIVERQHGNRGSFQRLVFRQFFVRNFASSGAVQRNIVNPNWPLDVLQALLTHILENKIEPVAHVITDRAGDRDPARLGNAL